MPAYFAHVIAADCDMLCCRHKGTKHWLGWGVETTGGVVGSRNKKFTAKTRPVGDHISKDFVKKTIFSMRIDCLKY